MKKDPYNMHQPRMAKKCMAHGGAVQGPGGPTEDEIPAMLSDGEYVLPADTVEIVGKEKLDLLRRATHKPVREGSTRRPGMRKMANGGSAYADALEDQRRTYNRGNTMGASFGQQWLKDNADNPANGPMTLPKETAWVPDPTKFHMGNTPLSTPLGGGVMSGAGLGQYERAPPNTTGPTSRGGGRNPYEFMNVPNGPRRRGNNRKAVIGQPSAVDLNHQFVEPDPQVAKMERAGYWDRSGQTEQERLKLLQGVDNQLNQLGPLNMASKRQMAANLLGQKTELNKNRMGQLSDADRGNSLVDAGNLNRDQEVGIVNAGLKSKGLDRRAESAAASATAAYNNAKLAYEQDPNSIDNRKKLLDMQALVQNQKRAAEMHDATIGGKNNAEFDARVDARVKDGVPRDQAMLAEQDMRIDAGDNPNKTAAGRAIEGQFARGIGERANKGNNGMYDIFAGQNPWSAAEISAEDMYNLNSDMFKETEVGGLTGMARKWVDKLPWVETPPMKQLEYTGKVPEGERAPSFMMDEEDPLLESWRKRKNIPSSGY